MGLWIYLVTMMTVTMSSLSYYRLLGMSFDGDDSDGTVAGDSDR